MKSFSTAILAAVATRVSAEEVFDIEAHIVKGFSNLRPEGSELISFENERGKPLMHAPIDDRVVLADAGWIGVARV